MDKNIRIMKEKTARWEKFQKEKKFTHFQDENDDDYDYSSPQDMIA